MILDAIVADSPLVSPDVMCSRHIAWCKPDYVDRYLGDQLIERLVDLGRSAEAGGTASDWHWVGTRLGRFWPDPSVASVPRAMRQRAAHLLGPADSDETVVNGLQGWVADEPDWGRKSPLSVTSVAGRGGSTGDRYLAGLTPDLGTC
jgi:hypothetical protein